MTTQKAKNEEVLKGWNTNWEQFDKFFHLNSKPNKIDLEKIKKYAIKKIHEKIDQNEKISDFVFKGIRNFKEPYTATWFYEKGELKRAEKIPFTVTTGSERSNTVHKSP